MYFGCIPLFSNLKQWSHESIRWQSRRPLQALWIFLLSSHWLTSSRAHPCAKWISTVGKRLYVNALTESERLNDTEYRSETCSEAKLIVVRPGARIIYPYNIYFTIDNAPDLHIKVYSTFQMTTIYAKSKICNDKVICSYTREAMPLGAKWKTTLTSRAWHC